MEETLVSAKKYELMLVLSPRIPEENRNKEIEEVRKFIASHGGKIDFEDIHGMRQLAYRIKQQSQGFFAVLDFSIPAETLEEFQKNLNINQAVVRYLLLALPDNYEQKTMAYYDEEGLKMKEAAQKEKEEKRLRKTAPRIKAKPVKKEVKPKKAPVKLEEEVAKKSTKPELDELDKKLKSIIDNPDISL